MKNSKFKFVQNTILAIIEGYRKNILALKKIIVNSRKVISEIELQGWDSTTRNLIISQVKKDINQDKLEINRMISVIRNLDNLRGFFKENQIKNFPEIKNLFKQLSKIESEKEYIIASLDKAMRSSKFGNEYEKYLLENVKRTKTDCVEIH